MFSYHSAALSGSDAYAATSCLGQAISISLTTSTAMRSILCPVRERPGIAYARTPRSKPPDRQPWPQGDLLRFRARERRPGDLECLLVACELDEHAVVRRSARHPVRDDVGDVEGHPAEPGG